MAVAARLWGVSVRSPCPPLLPVPAWFREGGGGEPGGWGEIFSNNHLVQSHINAQKLNLPDGTWESVFVILLESFLPSHFGTFCLVSPTSLYRIRNLGPERSKDTMSSRAQTES